MFCSVKKTDEKGKEERKKETKKTKKPKSREKERLSHYLIDIVLCRSRNRLDFEHTVA